MNYTDSQITTWIKQLSKSFRSSNFAGSCTYDMVVKKFLEQITNGVSVKIHRNCVLNPVECVIKSLQCKECYFFESPGSSDFAEMANKKKVKATAKTKSNVRNSNKANRNKPQSVDSNINNKTVVNNSEDNPAIVSEHFRSDGGFDNRSDISNLNYEVSVIAYNDSVDDIVSSTPRAQSGKLANGIAYGNEFSDELLSIKTSRSVHCTKNNKTFIPEEVVTKRKTRSCRNNDSKTQHIENSQGLPNDEASLQAKGKNHFSLHDLLDLMSGKADNSENFANKREYIQKHITLEPTGANEGAEILFKLPNCINTRATIDLRDSKQMAEMMFLPVLADEQQRYKGQKPAVPATSVIDVTEYVTTTTTSTAPYQIHDGHVFPQVVGLSESQQHALLQPSFTLYQPNLKPKKRNRGRKTNTSLAPLYFSPNSDSFYPYISNGPYALPCVLLPNFGNPPKVTKGTPKNVDKNQRSGKNTNRGKQNSSVLPNTTQSVPVRVTSTNGYDSTHYVNLPLNGYQDSSSLDVTQASTPESSGYSTLELSNTVTNFQNGNLPLPNYETLKAQTQKKRGRPKKQVPNQNKILRKRAPPKTKISVENTNKKKEHKKIEKENIQTVISGDKYQEESFIMNNESFLACLDMPLINEEAPTDKSHTFHSSAGQIQQESSVEPVSNSKNIQPQTTSTATLYPNWNVQPFFTNCSISENVKNVQNVTGYLDPNSFSVPNGSIELLERFYIGEVGEVLENEIESSVKEEQQICNKSLENTIVLREPTQSLITAENLNNDNLLFWDNENPYKTNNNENFIAVITSENSNTKSASSHGTINGMETNNVNATTLNISGEIFSFYDSYDLQQDGLLDQHNKTPLNTSVTMTNPTEGHIKKNDAKNADISITQSQNIDVFRNFEKNLIEDHSYSMQISQSQCSSYNEKALTPVELETKSTNGSAALNMGSYNNKINNTCLWMQSEYIQSPFTEFSESCQVSSENVLPSDLPEEHMDFLTTPSLRMIEETQPNSSTENLQNFNSTELTNNAEPSKVNQIQKFSKAKDDVKESTTEKHTNITTQSPLTVKSSQTKASLQESDLFLPPLELESKLNNDILDFDCESISSSKDSLLGDDSKSESEKSIGYSQNSVENNEPQDVNHEDIVFCSSADCSTKCLKSWLGNQNNQVDSAQSANYRNLPVIKPSQTPKNNLNAQEKLPESNMIFLNKITSRRNSEIGFSNTKLQRTPYRQSIDTIPANLFSFKTPKLSEMKHAMDYRNFKHSEQSELSKNHITNLLKQNLIQDLKIYSPLKNGIPQFSGNVNSFNQQQVINTNLSMKNGTQNEYPFDKFQIKHRINNSELLNEEKISPVHSVIEMAKFFNITCFPSLIENCPNGTLCHLSHNLRDIDSVRVELRRLHTDEVDILYTFIYKHRILYTYYFNEFCYYYTENQKVSSLYRMLVDFQRYQSFRPNKLMIIYNCLLDCGLDKKNSCENILKNLSRRSSEYLNAAMDIIVESDWTFFVNNVREIVSDPNIILNGNTLKKMAESFINNPDDSILGLFWQCIFKLDAAELQATQGHPAIQMIARKYQLFMTSLTNFYQT